MKSKKTVVFALLITAMILPFNMVGPAEARENSDTHESDKYESDIYNSEIHVEVLTMDVIHLKYINERLEIIQKAHSYGIISDDDYFYEVLYVWDQENMILNDALITYNLDVIDTDDVKYIKNIKENSVAKKLLDALFASK